MRRSCDSCGKPYEAKTSRSKFCGTTCRVRSSRGAHAPAEVTTLPDRTPDAGLAAAVREELGAAGRADTMLGRAALALAARIDAQQDTGSGIAALARELRATIVAAMAGVQPANSPVIVMRDELASRRKGA